MATHISKTTQEQITLQARDGACKVWVVKPEGNGSWPGVIFYMDAFGIRPAMLEMAAHIASHGYFVLLPDLYYRYGSYGPFNPKEVLKGDFMSTIGPIMACTNNHKAAEDTACLLAYLDGQSDVAGKKVGTVGFCMGGGMAITAAAYYPNRVAAAASFHGGRLATDEPTSPHLLLPKIKGQVYVAGADEDQSYPPEMAKRFQKAIDDANVRNKCEIYKGKKHGWMKPDMPVYDKEAAERGWKELFTLYSRALS
jgi:carboxymethylenebutenolidase